MKSEPRSEASEGDDTSSSSGSPSSWLARLLPRALGAVALLAGLLGVGVWAGWGMDLLVPYAVQRFSPEGWSVELGDVEGSWLSRIEIDSVAVSAPTLDLDARRVAIRYRLRPLLDKKVDIQTVELDRPILTVSLPDSAAAEDEDEGPGALRSLLTGRRQAAWDVVVDSVRIIDGHVELVEADQPRYTLSGLQVAGSGSLGEGLSVQLDTLGSDFVSRMVLGPDSTFSSAGRLALQGQLSDGVLRLDTLAVESEHSRVFGGGRMVFADRPELWSQVDLEVAARPLDLRDLPMTLPEPLRDRPEVSLEATATGHPDSLVISMDARAFGGSTVSEGRAVVRSLGPRREGRPALEGSLTLEGLELAPWSAPPFDGEASAQARFVLSHFGPVADYEAEGSVRHVPGGAGGPRLLGRPLEADFDVVGSLPGDSVSGTPLRADARLSLTTDGPTGRLGTVTADVEGTSASWRVDLALGEGSLEGRGSAGWPASGLTATVESLRATTFDLAAVDSLYPDTRITGELRGSVRGGTPAELQGTVEVTLGDSRIAETALDSLWLRSRISGSTYDGVLRARSSVGDVRTQYSVALEDSFVRFEADSLAYVRPDTAGAPEPLGELYGVASGSWALGERREGTLEVALDSARWGATSLTDGDVSARLSGDGVDADGLATVSGLLPSPVRARVRAELDDVLASEEGGGLALSETTGSMSVAAARPHPDSSVRVDTLYVDVVADEPGRYRLSGSAQPAEGGRLDFDGSARVFQDSLSFDVEARGGLGRAMSILGGADVDSVEVVASGRRVAGRWEALEGDVMVAGAHWRQLTAERALASIRYDSTGIVLDTLDVRSNVFQAFGQGRLPSGGGGGRIEMTAELLDLEPVRELAGLEVLASGDAVLEATASGSLDSLSWTGDADLEALVVNRMRMTGVRFQGEGVVEAPYDFLFGLASSDMELTLDRIILPQSEVRTLSITAAGGSDSLRVAADAIVDDRRSGSMLIHVDPRPDRRTVRIEDLRFQIDEDPWSLVDQAQVSYAGGISVEPVLLRAGQQEIRLHGGISEEGELDLNARMDSTDVGTVADLAGFPRLRGWLSGRVRVQGTTAAPEAWLDMSGAFHRENRPPGPVEVQVRANGRRVRGSVELLDANEGLLSLTGGGLVAGAERGLDEVVGGGGSDGPTRRGGQTVFGLVTDSIDVTLTADTFDLRWTEAFFTADVLASVGGTLDGSIQLEGSSADPELSGAIRMRGGTARPTALGVRYDDLRMTLRGDGTRLVVDSARVSSPPGVATASGTVDAVGAMALDLNVGLNDFRAIRTDAYWAVASGSLNVGGVVRSPEIEGDLRLEALDIFLDERVSSEGLEPVELTEEDLRMLRERFGVVPETGNVSRPLAERITADLEVVLGRDSWLRKRTSPEMAVPFSGTIEVQLRPGQPPLLQGSVDVIEGRGFVEQFGRRFSLSTGTVTFSGPPEATRVDLEATYTIPSRDNPDDAEVTIILSVEGTQDDLGLMLSSNPPLENADIVSYIATGRPAAGSLSFEGQGGEGGGLVAAGADFALSQMTSLIESAAARSVGLDVVEIRREGLRQATLVAGKYVTPRLYVGFAQPVSLQEGDGLSFGSEGRSELEIEYEAWRWLLLNVEGSGSSVRFFLRGRHAY